MSQLKFTNKILLSYLIVVVIVFSLLSSLVYVYYQKIENDFKISNINSLKERVNLVHQSIAELAALSESIMIWDNNDYEQYHSRRIRVDSILFKLKSKSRDVVLLNQIDSLHILLKIKEAHLIRIMKAIQLFEETDSLFVYELSTKAKNIVKLKTITRKKNGIAGLFGKKETIFVPYFTDEISTLNKELISYKKKHNTLIEIYVDSLRIQNRVLNRKLYDFVSFLDDQMQKKYMDYYMGMMALQESYYLLIVVILIVVPLFIIFVFIVQFKLRKKEKARFQLQQYIKENEELLEIRKKIIFTVSHDIRGPLGNIYNCVDLVSETREKKKREIYLDDIRHSCQHVLHLVNDLMDAYRINEAGDLRNDTPFYLDRFLQRISEEFSRKAVAKALFLQSEHLNSSFVVKGDADKLEQVLANLLTNAIKFTPSGTISFYSKYLEGKLHIEIRDTGIGMDEETLKRIFAPFERAAQNVNSEGFGLGLFLTKGLVKVLNGIITVESTPGKGSTFKLEFLLPETDELVEEDKPDSDSITILPKSVLIVDDDPILLKIAEDMLGRKGISCTTCMNFQEVVAALGKSDYDIVLTDVQMPDTDGFALLRLLRNSDIGNSRTIPVAVMTARGDGNSGIYEKEGFAGCIHKPFNIHALLTFLSTIMSQIKISQTGDFDFSCLLDSTDDYEHMMSLVIMESRKEIEELKIAIKTTNRESMRKTIHRMMPVWEILGKEHMLRDFQERLHDMNTSDETICEQGIQIIEWIEKLIKEAENELKKYENTDS